ncbi:hypothetical protein [Yinghuangia soli]|uniref:Uncharacterized protein n=1 Tax=Yinghuangia soli TaxID=2908204 RepID=A0AA41TYD0_9ACTN|nr:hypothetical protein [Yinghuangia soli]MCF2526035.1 hypothetical protein [Yinghuangia soli]
MGQHRFIPRKPRGRGLLVVAGVLSVTAGLGVAAYAEQTSGDAGSTSAARCTLKPNPDQSDLSESRSCFTVDASLDRAPAVGETATIRFTVTAEHAAKNVRVEADLPAGMTWAALPAGLTGTTVADPAPVTGGTLHRAATDHAFKAGQVRTYEGKVTAVAPGSTEIRVRAGSGRESIGEDTVFLTMAQGSGVSAFGVAAAAAAPGATTTATLPSRYAGVIQKKVPADPAPTGPNDDAPWTEAAKTAAGTACVTGQWAYVDDTGATRLVVNATVEAWDADTDSAHDRLAVGTTGSVGDYRICFPNTDAGGQDVYLKFITETSRYRVQKTGTPEPYVFVSRTIGNTLKGSTNDFGPLKPADPALMRAWAAFKAANDLWRWVPGGTCWDEDDAVCRKHILNWTPGGTGGTYYRGDINETFLNGIEPKAPFIVVHEMGHALMDDLYEDAPPPLDCASPHYLHRPTGPNCAWVEGFAHWVAASALDDPWVRWPVGAPSSLETANLDWDDGDTVEGRVAGALVDISDYMNDGSDTYGEGSPAYIWKTTAKHRPKTFREFWDARRTDGYNVASPGALKCLWQNTIMY